MRGNWPFHMTLRTWIGRHPRPFDTLFRTLNDEEGRRRLIEADTEIVFDGFPRSGNSFTIHALTWAENRPVKAAWGVHAPSQIIGAVRAGKPACVLIRDPTEATYALLRKHPQHSVNDLLCAYLVYYSSLLPYSHGFVVAIFDDVIRNFGAIISAVNTKFGTGFRVIDLATHESYSEQFLKRSQRAIERDEKIKRRFELALSNSAGRKPSRLQRYFRSRLLGRCIEVYERYLDLGSTRDT